MILHDLLKNEYITLQHDSVMQFCIGDVRFQWKRTIVRGLLTENPSTNQNQNWHIDNHTKMRYFDKIHCNQKVYRFQNPHVWNSKFRL